MFRFVCVALFASLAAFSSAGDIDFDKCASTGLVVGVTISDCEKGQVCQFVKGEYYDITVTFVPSDTAAALNYKITGSVGIITIPIKEGNACHTLTDGCPAEGQIITTFTDRLLITDQYVEIAATVKILMTDDKDRTVACVTTDAEIVGAKKPTIFKTLA